MKIFSISALFFLMLVCSIARADAQADTQILEGLNLIYDLRFDEAENVFLSIQKSNPADIKGYFYESLIYFYKAMPSRNEEMFNKYIDLSEKVIQKSEDLLDKNENDYDALYYKGLTHSYVSLLMLSLNKSLLKAASNGNDGYRILSSLIERKPDYYDAYMGLGLYKVALGFVPEKFKWLLSLIGFEGNIKDGVKYLNISKDKGKFTRTDSKVFLSIFSLREKEDNDKTALKYSEELISEFPQSAVFRVFYSSILLQYGFTQDAIDNANTALELNKPSFFKEEIIKSSNAVLGTAYFRLNEYDKSIPYLENYMKLVNYEDRYNVYLFTLAVAYELTGSRSAAIDRYAGVRKDFINERDGELDKFFYRYAREKIKKPLNEFDKKLITGMNLRESFKLKEALDIYDEIRNDGSLKIYNSDDDLIKYYFDAALTYSYSGDYKKAEEFFKKCIQLKPENETWLVPHSFFELGKIYSRTGRKAESEEMFERVHDYDDFDFESFLDMRLANFRNK
ncbi:MAG: DUF3808 domain-containing protein [Bacteroidetes bacterium]|nr:DUF3808 domain-containing protein [Bacteroidota bacterium]